MDIEENEMGRVEGKWPPYVNRKGVDHITGVMSRVLTVLSDHLSFCYQLVPMDKGGWGIKLPNGTWTGMMGMCYRGEVDVVLGPAGINEDRIADFDLSIPLFYDQQVIAYQRPKLEPELLGFIKPFTPMMWLFIGLMMVLMFIITSVLLVTYNRWHFNEKTSSGAAGTICEQHGGTPVASLTREEPWKNTNQVMLWTYGAMLNQALSWVPSSYTERVIGTLWLLVALIISTVYCSNLMAMIIIPKVNIPFTNLEGLVDQTKIPYILVGGSVISTTLQDADNTSLFGRVWARKAALLWTYEEGARMILHERFAIIVDHTTILNLLHNLFSK
ncbi:glutamate receptor ionotropic, kainate 4-like, partial [Cherax quadricarinatus]|uniref:glutamate receptor ionotropic, kainate 4-like n=1 Tax=Cherax quadricarinatus TaxID=27406 RepID=UPI00387E5F89